MLLASKMTGFDVEWIDGVVGESVSPKAMPMYQGKPNMAPGIIGCWRAHMDIMVA
jgi:hypothetical protein